MHFGEERSTWGKTHTNWNQTNRWRTNLWFWYLFICSLWYSWVWQMSLLSLVYSYFILEIPVNHSELLFTQCSEHTVHGPVIFLSSRCIQPRQGHSKDKGTCLKVQNWDGAAWNTAISVSADIDSLSELQVPGYGVEGEETKWEPFPGREDPKWSPLSAVLLRNAFLASVVCMSDFLGASLSAVVLILYYPHS